MDIKKYQNVRCRILTNFIYNSVAVLNVHTHSSVFNFEKPQIQIQIQIQFSRVAAI